MATVNNIVIDQGSTFSLTINLENDDGTAKDLADYSAFSQIRKSYYSTTYTNFTIVKNDATGIITISLSPEETTALKPGRYVYDLEISAEFETIRVIEGIATITPEVSRA